MDLRVTAGAVRLPWAVVEVRGPDALGYLQGQLSQDVARLDVEATKWSLLLEPTGKTIAWLRVTRRGEDAWLLDAPAEGASAIVTRLQRFLLRTEAEVVGLDWQGVAVRGPGAESLATVDETVEDGPLLLPAGWPGVEGVDLLGPSVELPDGFTEASASEITALRIEAGVPALGAEITPDTIPAELGDWLIERSVSFTKGCFTGQELVARIDSRGGNVPRPVRGMVLADAAVPPVGSEVMAAGSVVGAVTSAARSEELGAVALAPLRRSVKPGDEVEIRGGGESSRAEVRDLPLR